ncbi:flagellar hook-basal body complex protein FliE [Lysobacter sp. N42]|uniref:flagellar hook-basal body complex protein FliE n=1 Tax=Lysobacter sp. N42 TaxID=2545719 RepID=UPI001048058C|nr:flagellar hook-basal body complex protein FliE [Lysobacter sp. N42]TCZ80367.1 flagellar hook-basal body complex protein FliE [Lysobacter sp. N42]
MTDAISSVLAQIRAHEMRTRGLGDVAGSNAIDPGAAGVQPGASAPQGGFSATLSRAVDNVSKVQAEAGELQRAFEMGDPRADLARVMVAMQQSQVAFRATVEVRNRLVQAYQDVMNMPV